MSEYDSEPINGLPALPPEGEVILWQGAPDWRSLARRAFHIRKVAFYFAVLLAWSAISTLYDGLGSGAALTSGLTFALLAGAAIAILALLAWLIARTTVYTVTNRRVVMRFGVALPMTINLPFKVVESAALRSHADGTGDIVLRIGGEDRVAFLVLWPHVRPWHLARPQPMLRCLPEAAAAAETLRQALSAAAEPSERRVSPRRRAAAWAEADADARPLVSAVS